jgi:mono/diheme cytochrome c family protein
MKTNTSSYVLIAVLPLVAGVLAACDRAHPSPSSETPSADGLPPRPPSGPQPSFGPLIQQKEPPPPISGGTLTMAADRTTAVAADTDRDRVYIVDVPARAVRYTVELPRHSEPGRVAVDDTNHAYVVLRRSGGLATIDLATGAVSIREACLTPRGVAFDKSRLAVHVTCASGELVTLPVGPGDVVRRDVDRDLRDVIVNPGGTLDVTTFRSAKQYHVGKDGSQQVMPPSADMNLAWRAISSNPSPGDGCIGSDCGEPVLVVQQPTLKPVDPSPGGYGGGSTFTEGTCSPVTGIVTTQIRFGAGSVNLPEAVLPVDLATNGKELVVVAAGNAFTKALPQLFMVYSDSVRASKGGCVPTTHGNVPGQAVAAAFDRDDALIVQTREPAALHIMTEDRRQPWKTIKLADDSVADTGHAIFHSNAGGFIACASCHAEGADDSHVWTFVGMGPRRTPSLLGTVAGTEPFHWDGDMKDLRDIVDHVFVERMSGPKVDDGELQALSGWVFGLPRPNRLRVENEATARGRAVFNERCTGCHTGPMLTNNKNFDVGTGGSFQVPSLVGVGWHQPLLHSGCAKTLSDRFDLACGGDKHGDLSGVTGDQIGDLVKFLETL